MDSHRENRIRRLIYRSGYTAMKETDMILGRFAREVVPTMDNKTLDSYEDLLELGDVMIWKMVTGKTIPPSGFDLKALDALISFLKTRR